MKCLLLILALMVPQMALARIGETIEDCKKRYGQPSSERLVGEGTTHFLTQHNLRGYEISCYFADSICWKIIYRKLNGKSVDNTMVKKLLKLAAPNWEKIPPPDRPFSLYDDDPFNLSKSSRGAKPKSKFKSETEYWSTGLMRTNPEECAELGKIISEKANANPAPTAILNPLKTVSIISAEGQAFYDAIADQALFAAIHQHADAKVEVIDFDEEINSEVFAKAAAHKLLELIKINQQ